MPYLRDLTEAQKKHVCALDLDVDYTQQDIAEEIEREFGVLVTRQTVSNFLRSDEAARMRREVLKSLEEEWEGELLVTKLSRAHYLAYEALKIHKEMQSHPPTTETYRDLSKEFRQYLKLLNKEMEPINIHTSGDTKSPDEIFEQMFAAGDFDEDLELLVKAMEQKGLINAEAIVSEGNPEEEESIP